jgi:hypothetical protein
MGRGGGEQTTIDSASFSCSSTSARHDHCKAMDDRAILWSSGWAWHDRTQSWVWMSGGTITWQQREWQHEWQQREEESGQENPLPHMMGIPVHFNFKFGFKIKCPFYDLTRFT